MRRTCLQPSVQPGYQQPGYVETGFYLLRPEGGGETTWALGNFFGSHVASIAPMAKRALLEEGSWEEDPKISKELQGLALWAYACKEEEASRHRASSASARAWQRPSRFPSFPRPPRLSRAKTARGATACWLQCW